MDLIYRTLTLFDGGAAVWLDPGPAGDVARAGFFEAAAGAVTGTASTTLAGVVQEASGTVAAGGVTGTSTVTLEGTTQVSTGAVAVNGTAAQALAGVSSAATGAVAVNGTAAQSLAGMSQAANGAVALGGNATQTLSGATQTSAGAVPVAGIASPTLQGVVQSAIGAVALAGTAAQSLAGISQSSDGKIFVKGTAAHALDGVAQSANGQGTGALNGNSAVTLQGASQTASGSVPVTGTGFAILEGIVSLAAGIVLGPAGPVIPPTVRPPPADLAASAIVGQALRFMRLAPISRQDPDAEVIAALRQAYAQSLTECLEASDWSFASTLVVLPAAALPAGAAPDDAFAHSYQLPGDLLTIRRVGTHATRWRCDAGLMRANHSAPLTIRYTARIRVEAAMPATFKTAVALHIASLLGARWAGAAISADDIAMQAATTLKQAMREDSRHAAPEPAQIGGDLGYGGSDDWAHEATR